MTTDVERRFGEHKEGGRKGSKYARAKIPLKVVYTELHDSRSEAQKREYVIKQMSRTAKLELVKSAGK